ncbi:MAG: hypothetical protein IIB75_03905 [Proteobacteria bacterium]|nr:hypothetical protein [Pseudomonadota bacterium]
MAVFNLIECPVSVKAARRVIDPIRMHQEIRLSGNLPMHHAEILHVLFGNRFGKQKTGSEKIVNPLM